MVVSAMEWSDDAIVLALRPHGESAAILEALTCEHGRHLGLVHGGASSKRRATLQPGNQVRLTWRARLSEHLGTFTAEPVRVRAHAIFERRLALAGLNAFTAVAVAALPEREPHRPAFEGATVLLDAIVDHDFTDWAPLYVRWELGLLDELGFGLDLTRCAKTGTTENLLYVSPRTGRAVCAEGAGPYRDRLLALPAFLLGRRGPPAPSNVPANVLADLLAGLTLTEHFLDSSVLAPHDKKVPQARKRLTELAARVTTESR